MKYILWLALVAFSTSVEAQIKTNPRPIKPGQSTPKQPVQGGNLPGQYNANAPGHNAGYWIPPPPPGARNQYERATSRLGGTGAVTGQQYQQLPVLPKKHQALPATNPLRQTANPRQYQQLRLRPPNWRERFRGFINRWSPSATFARFRRASPANPVQPVNRVYDRVPPAQYGVLPGARRGGYENASSPMGYGRVSFSENYRELIKLPRNNYQSANSPLGGGTQNISNAGAGNQRPLQLPGSGVNNRNNAPPPTSGVGRTPGLKVQPLRWQRFAAGENTWSPALFARR